MNAGTDPTRRIDFPDGESAAPQFDVSMIAHLAFGKADRAEIPDGEARHLALLPKESLELDLSDPAQRRFGDYELLELIGEGGMGVVYRARQRSLDREVAVKLLSAGPWASKEFVERFQREAQNAARMQHPNIVAIYEVDEIEELHFFSMRLVHGPSLAALIKREKKLPAQRAATLLRTIAEALDYAHRLGVLHLDLKPANVLIDENGVPHVADFGLSRRLEQGLAADNNEVSGTPSYMAPEQASAGAQKITPATDIWGLGAILYELVTGEPPYLANSPQNTLKLVVNEAARDPCELVPGLQRDLAAIIEKCMAHDTSARYASARDLADDLGRFLAGYAVKARPLNTMQRTARWARRQPYVAAFAALFVAALGAGLIATTLQWRRAEANAQRADRVREFLVGVLKKANPDENKGQPVTARQLLDYGARELDAPTAQDPAIQADLASTIGTLYWLVGDYAHADTMLARAGRVFRLPGVPDDVRARTLNAFALAEKTRHKFTDANAHAREALALAERIGDATDASEARYLDAETLFDLGNTHDAETLLREALADDRTHFGNDSDNAINDLILLGGILRELSRPDESIVLTRDAADAATRRYGRINSKVISALDYQARALMDSSHTAEALQAAGEAASLAQQLYGPEHPDTIARRSNLAGDLRAAGRYADALKIHLDALRVDEKNTAERPEQLGYAYSAISADYLSLGNFAKAEDFARQAIAAWRRLHNGEDYGEISAVPTGLLAAALQWQGDFVEAESAYRRQIALTPASIWLDQAQGAFGDMLRMAHRYDDAKAILQSTFTKMPAKPSAIRASIEAELAMAQLESGDPTSSKPHAANALATMRSLVPAGSPWLSFPLFVEARVLLASGDATQTESLAREARAARGPQSAADDPRVLETDVVRVEALRALGRDAEATALAAQVHAALPTVAKPIASDLDKRLSAKR